MISSRSSWVFSMNWFAFLLSFGLSDFLAPFAFSNASTCVIIVAMSFCDSASAIARFFSSSVSTRWESSSWAAPPAGFFAAAFFLAGPPADFFSIASIRLVSSARTSPAPLEPLEPSPEPLPEAPPEAPLVPPEPEPIARTSMVRASSLFITVLAAAAPSAPDAPAVFAAGTSWSGTLSAASAASAVSVSAAGFAAVFAFTTNFFGFLATFCAAGLPPDFFAPPISLALKCAARSSTDPIGSSFSRSASLSSICCMRVLMSVDGADSSRNDVGSAAGSSCAPDSSALRRFMIPFSLSLLLALCLATWVVRADSMDSTRLRMSSAALSTN